MIQARSVVLYTLKNDVQLPGSREMRDQRLLRFVQFAVPDALCLGQNGTYRAWPLLLILDRTHWKLGQHDPNILLLSVRWHTFSFPLVWTLLPHSGNSSMTTRIALVERVLPLVQRQQLLLAADREFVGEVWFTALRHHGISPVIRLRADSRVNGIPVWALFKKMTPGELRVWYRPALIYGVRLRVLAIRNAFGHTLFLAYQGHAEKALKTYTRRWTAKNMHQALKSRGFFLESTHLTDPERVSTLLTVVSLAFVWCCLAGEFEEQLAPARRLKHGCPPRTCSEEDSTPYEPPSTSRKVIPPPPSSPSSTLLTPREGEISAVGQTMRLLPRHGFSRTDSS